MAGRSANPRVSHAPPVGGHRIRPARAADLAAVEGLVASAYTRYVDRIGRPPAPMTADYANLIAAGVVHVAEGGAGVEGLIVLLPASDHLLVENVAVLPEHQGRGLGRLLMAFAEERARTAGVNEVRLYTNERMTENLGFYAALGYDETGRRVEDGFSRVYFRKRLAPPPRA